MDGIARLRHGSTEGHSPRSRRLGDDRLQGVAGRAGHRRQDQAAHRRPGQAHGLHAQPRRAQPAHPRNPPAGTGDPGHHRPGFCAHRDGDRATRARARLRAGAGAHVEQGGTRGDDFAQPHLAPSRWHFPFTRVSQRPGCAGLSRTETTRHPDSHHGASGGILRRLRQRAVTRQRVGVWDDAAPHRSRAQAHRVFCRAAILGAGGFAAGRLPARPAREQHRRRSQPRFQRRHDHRRGREGSGTFSRGTNEGNGGADRERPCRHRRGERPP